MAINKINVKNKIYDFGGSGSSQAKLVATGIYSQEVGGFVFDKENITSNDKFYVCKIFDIHNDMWFYSEFFNVLRYMQPIKVHYEDIVSGIYEEVILVVDYTIGDNNLFLQDAGEFIDGDIIEIFELPFVLPFTIGGAE